MTSPVGEVATLYHRLSRSATWRAGGLPEKETRAMFGPQESTHKGRPQHVLGEKSEERYSVSSQMKMLPKGSHSFK